MGLEVVSTIQALVEANPTATDPRAEGDDHLRLIKSVLKLDAVDKSSNQTIAGVKNFSSPIVIAAATAGAEALRLDQKGVLAQNIQNANYTTVLADGYGASLVHSSATPHTHTIAANASVAYPLGVMMFFDNQTGAGALTIACNDTLEVIGDSSATTLKLGDGEMGFAYHATSTKWRAGKLGNKLTQGTAAATTSGTAHNFPIANGAKFIRMPFSGVTMSGGVWTLIARLGTGGAPATAGYECVGAYLYAGQTTIQVNPLTTGVELIHDNTISVGKGCVEFTLIDAATNLWHFKVIAGNQTASESMIISSGNITLAGVLDVVQLTSSQGRTFSGGKVNVQTFF